jgi:hypothetical protein
MAVLTAGDSDITPAVMWWRFTGESNIIKRNDNSFHEDVPVRVKDGTMPSLRAHYLSYALIIYGPSEAAESDWMRLYLGLRIGVVGQ